jgi:phosphoserine phosphatase
MQADGSGFLHALRDWWAVLVMAAGLGLYALIERLRRIFVTTAEMNGVGVRVDEAIAGVRKRVDLLEMGACEAEGRAESDRDRIVRIEERDRHTVELWARTVVEPLQQVARQMEALTATQTKQGQQLATTTATLSAVVASIDRLERRMDSHHE